MGFRRAGALFGLAEESDDFSASDRYDDGAFDADATDDDPSSEQGARGDAFQITIVRPRNFRDAATVGEYFREDIPVIINLEDMEDGEARRIVDFAAGLILGRRGEIERLSRRIFLILPAEATLHIPQDKLTDEGFFNQA